MTSENDDTLKRNWRRTARGRLKFELEGVAFARKHGLSPEDFANHLWSEGAPEWIKTQAPSCREYLLKEIEAFRTLYPDVEFDVTRLSETEAELVFRHGACLGGWGKDQWAAARSLGLGKGHVCRYCRRAFKVWSSQLGLEACPEPKKDGTCVLTVRKST